MLQYIVRRLLLLPVILLGVTIAVFLLLQLLSPYQRVATFVTSPAELKNNSLDALIAKYHLADPFYKMYFDWMGNLLHGNLGWSEVGKAPVVEALFSRFPATLELALFAALPMAIGGVVLGVVAARHHNKLIDHVSRIFAVMGWSLPSFVAGLLFLLIFYGVLGWFPPGRLSVWATQVVNSPGFTSYTGLMTLDGLLNGRFDIALDALRHLVGPVVTLAYLYWALLLRMTRSSMLETLQQDYVQTARAKGVRETIVVYKHALRNGMIPVATLIGIMVLGLLGGVIITETVFNYPGIGKFTALSASQLDYPSILGIAILYGTLLVLINLAVDVTYALIDPRVRLD